ncbi:sugar O-acetyltransferase [Corynebacterium sp.]|uniref:sugar O-acetyltransferase n=1 Tax=Corynebacterium sp. TaxID=1720 RepID=UPI0026DBBB2D|nr:sugar O-acetyltransferase [Corynebacterium sp.]MDO4609137.1 sugar O-acetyltransferase [Corynebacterium sp.]
MKSLMNTGRDADPGTTLADDGRTMRERMLAGDWYIADDPELQELNRRAMRLAGEFNAENPRDPEGSQAILAELLGSVGDGTEIRAPIHVDYGVNLYVGAHCFINFGFTALDVAEVRIGDHVQIGTGVQLLTPTHPLAPEARKAYIEAADPIEVGDNVWIGGGAIILGGIRVGEDAVIGAGAVVTKDVPAGALVVGNPARVIRELR